VDANATVIESQLDWLTCEVHTAKRNQELEALAAEWMRSTESGSNKVSAFRLNGYVGWHCGRVSYGTRQAAGLLQLSGDLAREHFDSLYPLVDHFSRIDLAVTTRVHMGHAYVGHQAYSDAMEHFDLHPKSALPWQVRDARGGMTVYLGDRSSDFFFRLYDKEAESTAAKDDVSLARYKGCWRAELELKGMAARQMAEPLYRAENRSYAVSDFVADYAKRHGIQPPFVATGTPIHLSGLRRRSDRMTRLNWLATSVRPAVQWLLETGEAADVLEALGMDGRDDIGPIAQPEQPF